MITKDMTIGEMVQQYPSAAEVLMNEGVHCVGCGAAHFETIEQGLAGHGKTEVEIAEVVRKLNDSIPKEEGNENLVITENAANKAKELLEKREKDNALRITVTKGGCAGNEYTFSFEESKQDNDNVVEVSGVKFFINSESMDMLKGSKIDYVDALQGAGFKITNPNAKSTCGCGQSFN
jgi:iron-sulfur cluster assembly protein